jgi:VanZ family protein
MKPLSGLPVLRLPSWLILGALGVLILLQQLVQLPGNSMMRLALNNAAHTPFFTVLTLLLWQLHPLASPRFDCRQKLLLLAAAMALLATSTELAQVFTRRDASLQDWLRNLLGTLAGFCFIVLWQVRKRGSRTRQVALGLLGLLLLAYGFRDVIGIIERQQQRLRALPHLLVMEEDYLRRMARRTGGWRLGSKGDFYAAASREQPADARREALLLLLDQGNYPGLTLREPYPDWRDYQWLIIEAESLDAAPLGLTVRVETTTDRGMQNAQAFLLSNRPGALRVPLDSLISGSAEKRPEIRNLLLFVERPANSMGLLLYDIRLE